MDKEEVYNLKLEYKNIKFALDIGTRSVIGTVGIVENGKLKIIKEYYVEHDDRAMIDGQIHDIGLVAKAVKEVVENLEKELSTKLEQVSIAAAGRYLKTVKSKALIEITDDQPITKDLIRTLQLTALKEGENMVGEDLDGSLYCVGYSVINYYLNGYLISNLLDHKGENIAIEIISTFLPKGVVESLYAVMNICNLKVSNLTLEPIAAIEAIVPKNLRLLNIALVDIGAGTSDIAISSNKTISAYGMVPFAGDKITEVIANECLVDFNCAEVIKRKINSNKEISFVDILGINQVKTTDELKEVIRPTVSIMAEQVVKNIVSLNGEKAPSAIFLVGGGAHTPLFIEEISKNIGLPKERIAIKDRVGIENCICENSMGSAGVTVIGIALVGLKDEGNNFIDVYLNNEPISLFNSFKHTVADVLAAADIDPSMLIGKFGKNIKFTINGKSKIIFGQAACNSIIKVNKQISSIETEIKAGDIIDVQYAVNGENGHITLLELFEEFQCKNFYINEKLYTTDPIVISNEAIVDNISNYIIKDKDDIKIIYPKTIVEIKKYLAKIEENLYLNGNIVSEEYIVNEGDKFITKDQLEEDLTSVVDTEIKYTEVIEESINISSNIKEDKEIEVEVEVDDNISLVDTIEEKTVLKKNVITITVNGKQVELDSNTVNLFFQVFNYVDIDLSNVNSLDALLLNGEKAGYTDILKDGDIVEVICK